MLRLLVIRRIEILHLRLLGLAEAEHVRVLALEIFVESFGLILIFQISKILKLELPRILRLLLFFMPTKRKIFQMLAAL